MMCRCRALIASGILISNDAATLGEMRRVQTRVVRSLLLMGGCSPRRRLCAMVRAPWPARNSILDIRVYEYPPAAASHFGNPRPTASPDTRNRAPASRTWVPSGCARAIAESNPFVDSMPADTGLADDFAGPHAARVEILNGLEQLDFRLKTQFAVAPLLRSIRMGPHRHAAARGGSRLNSSGLYGNNQELSQMTQFFFRHFQHVLNQMKPVGNLNGLRRAAAPSIAIEPMPVPADGGDLRMSAQPGRERLCRTFRQEIDHCVPLQIHQYRPVALTLPPCPVVYADDLKVIRLLH